MHTHTEQPSSENDRRTRTRPTDRPTDRADSRASATRPGRAEEAREPPDRKRVAWTMPEDIITYVCSDLSTNAPKAEAGLRDQACDRILGRYIQEEALERVRDDPEDLLACLRECITLDNEQLTPSLSPLFVKAETESPLHSPSPPYLAPEIPPPADPQTQYGLTSVIVPAKLRATVLSVCCAIHCPRAFSSFFQGLERNSEYPAGLLAHESAQPAVTLPACGCQTPPAGGSRR